MKVSTRVHYGLRAMTELARSYRQDRLLSIAEIARNEGLPLSPAPKPAEAVAERLSVKLADA